MPSPGPSPGLGKGTCGQCQGGRRLLSPAPGLAASERGTHGIWHRGCDVGPQQPLFGGEDPFVGGNGKVWRGQLLLVVSGEMS